MAIYPVHNSGQAISYIAASILGGFARCEVDVELWVPTSVPPARRPFVRNAVPTFLKGIAYRMMGSVRMREFTEWRYLRALRPGDVAYVWPGHSRGFCHRVRETGATLILELINCLDAFARPILDREAAAAGVKADHDITDEKVAQEREDLSAANFVFAPSPLVAESCRAEDVPTEKILLGSYGWGTDRIRPLVERRARGPADRLQVLFVGLICLRKGPHRLINAWKAAEISGELVLAGRVAPAFKVRWGADICSSSVRLLGHVDDIGEVYKSADIFAFPSFEEGSPLVTYEAMASGLPVVVSPMGGGGIARGEMDGAIVLPPEDTAGWINALRRLAAEPDLRAEFGRRAACRAANFDWGNCAAVRLGRLREAGILESLQSSVPGA